MHPRIFLCTALVAAVAVLLAGDVRAETLELDANETMARAIDSSPEARLARQDAALAAAEVAASRPLFPSNPTVGVSEARRNGTIGNDWSLDSTLTLYVPGQRGARLSAARIRLEAANARLAQVRRQLGTRAGSLFFEALFSIERAKLAAENERLADQLQNAAQTRFDAGAVGGLDVNLAHIEHARATIERLDAERDRITSIAELKGLLGLGAESDLSLRGDLGTENGRVEANLAELISEAKRQRGDLRAARLEATAASRDLLAARLGILPRPELSGGIGRDSGDDIARVGVSIALPIVQRNQGERRVARAQIAAAQARAAATDASVLRDVTASAARLSAARESVSVFDASVLKALEENGTLLEESYRAGKIQFSELLVLRREITATRTQYFRGRADLLEAGLALREALGREPIEDAGKGMQP